MVKREQLEFGNDTGEKYMDFLLLREDLGVSLEANH